MKSIIFALLINVSYANQILNDKSLHSCNLPHGYVDETSVRGFIFMQLELQFTEIWRDLPGWEDKYQVSNFGNAKSKPRVIERSSKGNMLWPGGNLQGTKDAKGYLYLTLSKDGKQVTMAIHRAVALTFLPNPHNLPQVNHIDRNKANNRADNLEWCDNSYNAIHNLKFGNIKNVRVTPEIVREIRASSLSYGKLGEKLGLCPSHVGAIKRKEKWKHV